ncbi:hypothetical protein CR513_62155, partial [Mucuna pruriens]
MGLDDGFYKIPEADIERDREDKPYYPRNKEEDMCKTFKFRLGMEFISLKQFKDVILEHSILNENRVKFVNNDGLRVRVECKKKNGRSNHTYKIKILIGKHNCERSNSKLTLNEIIDYMRTTFSTSIRLSQAFKARHLAREPRFRRFYMCLGDSKRTFKAAYMPFIGNKYGGQLLIAVGRDPNDQYLPIAFAVVES